MFGWKAGKDFVESVFPKMFSEDFVFRSCESQIHAARDAILVPQFLTLHNLSPISSTFYEDPQLHAYDSQFEA